MAKNKRLGKGLGALISDGKSTTGNNKRAIKTIDLDLIKPNAQQPRKTFDPEKLDELMQSINKYGIIQPIVVRNVSHGYEIIVGERRWRAAKNLELDEIPAIVKDVDDVTMAKLALIENIQREDLNRIEEAKGYKQLIEEYDLTQSELGDILGKSRSYISNLLRLLQLAEPIQQALAEDRISNGHCKALLGLDDRSQQLQTLQLILEKDLSVRATEKHVRRLKKPTKEKSTTKYRPPKEILYYENNLKDKFSTKVNIKHKKDNKGKIEIEYYSIDDLNRILNELK